MPIYFTAIGRLSGIDWTKVILDSPYTRYFIKDNLLVLLLCLINKHKGLRLFYNALQCQDNLILYSLHAKTVINENNNCLKIFIIDFLKSGTIYNAKARSQLIVRRVCIGTLRFLHLPRQHYSVIHYGNV